MITILHNPRCGKSREGLKILEESGCDFKIIKYLEESISKKDLITIIHKLQIKPIELVRKNEPVWKENYNGKNLSDEEVINILIENPILIERPIIINENQAIIGRPPVLIKDII